MKDAKGGAPKSALFEFEGMDYEFPTSAHAPVHDTTKAGNADRKRSMFMASVRLNPVYLEQSLCRPNDSMGPFAPPKYDTPKVINLTFDTSIPNLVQGNINGRVYRVSDPPVIIRMKKGLAYNPSSNPQFTPLQKQVS